MKDKYDTYDVGLTIRTLLLRDSFSVSFKLVIFWNFLVVFLADKQTVRGRRRTDISQETAKLQVGRGGGNGIKQKKENAGRETR